MNVLCFGSIIVKLVYDGVVQQEMDIAYETAKDDFIDMSASLDFFDIVNSIDSFLYMLMALSFMKTFVFWIPSIFKIFTDLLGTFFNAQTGYTFIIIISIGTGGTFMLANALGPFVNGMFDMRQLTIRSVVMASQGWFWQISEHYGERENLVSIEGHFMFYLYICLTFYIWSFTIIVVALFIGKVIEDLAKARKLNKELAALKLKNDLKVIELEIKKKKAQIDAEDM